MRTVEKDGVKELKTVKGLVKYISQAIEEGSRAIVSSGSQLPDGQHKAEITGYRLIKFNNEGQREHLALYLIKVKVKKVTYENESVLCAETTEEKVKPVGTIITVEPFERNGRRLNRFAVDSVPAMDSADSTAVTTKVTTEDEDDE